MTANRTLTTQFAYNGDGVRTSKTAGGTTTDYVLDLATTLPVVISDTDAIYLYGLDIVAEQLAGSQRYYLMHDGLAGVRHQGGASQRTRLLRVDFGFQGGKIGEVSILLLVVQTIPHDEHIREVEPYIV